MTIDTLLQRQELWNAIPLQIKGLEITRKKREVPSKRLAETMQKTYEEEEEEEEEEQTTTTTKKQEGRRRKQASKPSRGRRGEHKPYCCLFTRERNGSCTLAASWFHSTLPSLEHHGIRHKTGCRKGKEQKHSCHEFLSTPSSSSSSSCSW